MIKQEFNVIHTINLWTREDRKELILKEAVKQGVGLVFWEGEVVKTNPKLGICRSFKRIVQYAKDNNLERVAIAEDDMQFFGETPGAWKYFVDTIPDDYDLYLSGYYACDLVEGNRIMAPFSGMTLLFVHQRFYDFFLTGISDDCHIDRELGKHAADYKILFCDQVVAEQTGSRSDNVKTTVGLAGYRSFLKGRKIFGDVSLDI